MQTDFSKKSVFTGLFWRFAERVGAQGVKLLIEIVLARLLLPDDYGLIALVTVFITVLNVFVDSGLGNALIQKKDADDLDFSSVFWFNIGWCIILYLFLFVASPLLANFYDRPELTPVLRVLGIQIIISGVKKLCSLRSSSLLHWVERLARRLWAFIWPIKVTAFGLW